MGSGPGFKLCTPGHVVVLARAYCGRLVPAKEALSHDSHPTKYSHQEADRRPSYTKVEAQTRVVGEMSISEDEVKVYMWVLFASFFMFSNFYRLDSHTHTTKLVLVH